MFKRKKYIYHYHAIHNEGSGCIANSDGIITRSLPITSYDEYLKVKEMICTDRDWSIDKTTIMNISFLHCA